MRLRLCVQPLMVMHMPITNVVMLRANGVIYSCEKESILRSLNPINTLCHTQ